MLCRRSASFTMITRMSRLMARNILRRLSACFSSMLSTSMLVSLVTPSTSSATMSPKSPATSESEVSVSSTVSCRSAAHTTSQSILSSARMMATSTGWLMYISPERRFWSECFSAAKQYARSTLA